MLEGSDTCFQLSKEATLSSGNVGLDQFFVLFLVLPRPVPAPRVSMSLGFCMERPAAGHNEPLGIAVAARNNSSTSVNKLTLQLQQEVTWSAKGHPAKQENTLASVVVLPGSELGGFQWVSGSGSNYAQSVAPVAADAQNDLQQQLASGGGTRFQLVVPGDSLPTLQVENIKICHSVGVVVDTECCIAEPCVWAPFSVVPTAGAPGLQPGPASLSPAQTLTSLPPQTAQYSAGPYGSAPTDLYPNSNPSSGITYGSSQTVPYPSTNPPSGTTYGSGQTVPYSNNNPPSGVACGSQPGFAPTNVQYPTQQAVAYSGVEMDEYGHAKPVYVPQTAG